MLAAGRNEGTLLGQEQRKRTYGAGCARNKRQVLEEEEGQQGARDELVWGETSGEKPEGSS